MSEIECFLCKNILYSIRININGTFTKYSNSSLEIFLEKIFNYKIEYSQFSILCVLCLALLNELDLAEITYNRLKQKVLNYKVHTNAKASAKVNAYCQTDVFIENVLEFDALGKNKPFNKEAVSYCYEQTVSKSENEKLSSVKKYDCDVCFKKFPTRNRLRTHVKRVHVDSTECFKNVESIEIPKNRENNVNGDVSKETDLIINEDCRTNVKELNDEVEITHRNNRGRKKKHPGVLKPYKCSICPKTWKTLGGLKNHLSAHSDARPFICEVCGQAYKHKSALDVHVGMHNGIYPFMCMYCKKSFTQKGALQRHLPIHTGDTPYQCDLCGKRFVHHTSFNIHQLSHTGQKDYKCAECGLALLSGSHLKRHMRVHTGERNYACSFCGKRFAERYNLASHQKLHENPTSSATFKRNHRCQVCGASFNRRLKLEEHLAKGHQKLSGSEVPFLQQLFAKTDGIWAESLQLKLNEDGTAT